MTRDYLGSLTGLQQATAVCYYVIIPDEGNSEDREESLRFQAVLSCLITI